MEYWMLKGDWLERETSSSAGSGKDFAEEASGVLVKYKTELCRNWERGTCEYGKNCLFAHGKEEIRRKRVPDNYKTKLCVNMLRDGYCKYGSRCQFKHCDDVSDRGMFPGVKEQRNCAEKKQMSKHRLGIFLDIEKRCL